MKYLPLQHCFANPMKPQLPGRKGPPIDPPIRPVRSCPVRAQFTSPPLLGGRDAGPRVAWPKRVLGGPGILGRGRALRCLGILVTSAKYARDPGARSRWGGCGLDCPGRCGGTTTTLAWEKTSSSPPRPSLEPRQGTCASASGQGKSRGQLQMGSLAGAAHLLKHNAGVLRGAQ